MTDNDKLLAWQDNGSTPGKPSPDYFNDDSAAMSLLDTLVEKDYIFILEGSSITGYHATVQPRNEDNPFSAITSGWKPTRREAVVAAVLELIAKEGANETT